MGRANRRLSQCPQTKRLIEAAEQQGWTVTATSGGHIKFLSSDGNIVFAAATPSDHRAWRNTRARLRRHGLTI